MVIDIKDGDCVTNIIENFLLNILQEAYYDNEFKLDLIGTMEFDVDLDLYIEQLEEEEKYN